MKVGRPANQIARGVVTWPNTAYQSSGAIGSANYDLSCQVTKLVPLIRENPLLVRFATSFMVVFYFCLVEPPNWRQSSGKTHCHIEGDGCDIIQGQYLFRSCQATKLAPGKQEAAAAGKALKNANYKFDVAHTSVLSRAQHTLEAILKEIGQPDLPVQKSWRLNERHYGGLTGLNKAETAAKYGEEQVRMVEET
uniref:phosphoglycerate mutase (2,3-diphosphoglycerate-dependent) n=1 Tax=Timema douglasi TaxID=61478 RepID=A0A7R8VVE0_TIMDO|nr:unnamed protein product [Timema douglasi]